MQRHTKTRCFFRRQKKISSISSLLFNISFDLCSLCTRAAGVIITRVCPHYYCHYYLDRQDETFSISRGKNTHITHRRFTGMKLRVFQEIHMILYVSILVNDCRRTIPRRRAEKHYNDDRVTITDTACENVVKTKRRNKY